MPDLSFRIERAEPVPYAVAPMMAFTLAVENQPSEESVQNILLTAQIQIEATRRRYDAAEQARLTELFGEPHRWAQTLRSMLWTHASATIPSFTATTSFILQVPCTFDFNVATTKYFDGLHEEDIPLLFLFSGTVFYAGRDGALQAGRIPWSKEARYRLPVNAWRGLMDLYYPNSAWLTLRKDIFDKLCEYRARNGLTSWEQAFEQLLHSERKQSEETAAR